MTLIKPCDSYHRLLLPFFSLMNIKSIFSLWKNDFDTVNVLTEMHTSVLGWIHLMNSFHQDYVLTKCDSCQVAPVDIIRVFPKAWVKTIHERNHLKPGYSALSR